MQQYRVQKTYYCNPIHDIE